MSRMEVNERHGISRRLSRAARGLCSETLRRRSGETACAPAVPARAGTRGGQHSSARPLPWLAKSGVSQNRSAQFTIAGRAPGCGA